MPLLYKEYPLLENVRIVIRKKKNIRKGNMIDGNSLKRTEGEGAGPRKLANHVAVLIPLVGMRWVLLVFHVIFIGKWRCGMGMG